MSKTKPGAEILEAIARLCDRFEEAWNRGERPQLDDWLEQAGSARAVALPELVAIELDQRNRAGESASAGEYFERYPELAHDVSVAMRLIGIEFRAAFKSDPSLTEAIYRARYLHYFSAADQNPILTTPQLETTPSDQAPHAEIQFSSDPAGFLRSQLTPSDQAGDLGCLAEFRVTRVLGVGGMGIVVATVDTMLRREVVIKLMRPEVASNPLAKERFLREARAMAAIKHSRVVLVHQVGVFRNAPYLVMPLMAGESLAHRLRHGPALTLAETIRLGRETAEGLSAAHARGLIHRDIKPDNIWLEESEEGTHVRLLDFGLARDNTADSLTKTGAVFGTPGYMAPEQATGEAVDDRADLFSLGCVLYEMVTGNKAFAGNSITAILIAISTHRPPSAIEVNRTVSQALSALIDQLLNKKPQDRPRSASDLVQTLRSLEEAPHPSTVTWTRQVTPGRHKIPGRTLTIGCSVTLTLCLLVGVSIQQYSLVSRAPETGPIAMAPQGDDGNSALVPPSKEEPLRVESIAIRHFENSAKGDVLKGILGRDTFSIPRLGDRVQVMAKLSRPAYAYLLAFRPDGELELCFPDSETMPPPLTDSPRYPTNDQLQAYGLNEGTGLWVFAVVASDQPLPAYRDWISKHKPDWQAQPTAAGTVWWYDGKDLEPLIEGGGGQKRGKGETLTGPAATVLSLGKWLESAGTQAGIIAFDVKPGS